MAYDIVSSAYGWTDEQIGDLPLKRLRQIVSAIRTREFLKDRAESSRVSWMTRQIGMFVAAGYDVEEGKENAGISYAETLAFDDIERAALEGLREQGVHDEPKAPEPVAGSFEKLMGLMSQKRG